MAELIQILNFWRLKCFFLFQILVYSFCGVKLVYWICFKIYKIWKYINFLEIIPCVIKACLSNMLSRGRAHPSERPCSRRDIKRPHYLQKEHNDEVEDKKCFSLPFSSISTLVWLNANFLIDTSHLLLLGKFEYTGGPIFKVVLEC